MRTIVLFFCVILSACSIQEATEADHHSANEGYIEGPGVFSGAKGGFSADEVFSGKSNRKVGGASAYDVDLPAMDQDSFEEYERFKAWRRAQAPSSEEYKEWQEYRRYKQDQSK